MSYTPTDWKTGDVITADKLNNMESGIAGGQELFIIHATGIASQPGTTTTPVLDKTYNEIANAIQNGKIPFVIADTVEGQTPSKQVFPLATYTSGELDIYLFNLTIIQATMLIHMGIAVAPNACMSEYSIFTLSSNQTES